jgi:hypothetical protein
MGRTRKEIARINKQNAARSTGPRTPEGKARSRLNALKHGLCARSIALPNEDPAALAAREAAFRDQYRPQNPREAFLVQVAVQSTLRFDRCTRFETAELSSQVRAALMNRDTEHDEAIERFRLRIREDGALAIQGLRRSASGCDYLIVQWTFLRDALPDDGSWTEAHLDWARRLDDEFPLEARVLVGKESPPGREDVRARVLGHIEALIAELAGREAQWRAIEEADRAVVAERALIIADAALGARLLRYQNAALSSFFRSTGELEKAVKAREDQPLADVLPNEPEVPEGPSQTACATEGSADPPGSDPDPSPGSEPAAAAEPEANHQALIAMYEPKFKLASIQFPGVPQLNAEEIRNL